MTSKIRQNTRKFKIQDFLDGKKEKLLVRTVRTVKEKLIKLQSLLQEKKKNGARTLSAGSVVLAEPNQTENEVQMLSLRFNNAVECS